MKAFVMVRQKPSLWRKIVKLAKVSGSNRTHSLSSVSFFAVVVVIVVGVLVVMVLCRKIYSFSAMRPLMNSS